MLPRLAALFVIIGSLLTQLALPILGEIPSQTLTGPIAILWLLFASTPALIGALLSGFLLDLLSFDTPFGLFLFSYVAATFVASRLSRFSFQKPFVTYLLFALIVSLLSPLIELLLMLFRHQAITLPLLVWHVLIPASTDLLSALFWGLLALSFLARKRALKIV